jgi:hypothetical protein
VASFSWFAHHFLSVCSVRATHLLIQKLFSLFILRTSLFWNVTQCRLVVSYWRFGTTYLFLLQGSSGSSCTAWPFKMGPISCPETSVTNYKSTLRNNPEEWRFIYAGEEAWDLCFSCFAWILKTWDLDFAQVFQSLCWFVREDGHRVQILRLTCVSF